MINQVEAENNFFEEEPILTPMYFCDRTAWRPQKLRRLNDFFYDVDKAKTDILAEMKLKRQCREEIEKVIDMNEKELRDYNDRVESYKQLYYNQSDDIKKIILRDFVYKKMQLVNAHLLDKLDTGEAESD